MNIVMAGGGTGGHLFPALAIAKALEKELADVRITFVGTARRIEAKIVPREGYDIRFIRCEGMVGKNMFDAMKSVLSLPAALIDSFRILRALRPVLVIGVGGYSAGPVVLCAKLMGVPVLIHEQNSVPGLTNRILGKIADRIAVTYYESMKSFPGGKTFLTGNPVREEILKGDQERGYKNFSLRRDLRTIFVFGGSSGATRINSVVAESLDHLEPLRKRVQFLHQTGERDFNVIKELYRSKGFRGTVLPFAHEMADAYAVADLIISRAGATTLAELTACGKAAILVPYPHAAGNHQEINARKIWDMGAAKMILDKDMTGKSLADMIMLLIDDSAKLAEMERISRSLGSRDAARKVVDLIRGMLKKKGGKDVVDYAQAARRNDRTKIISSDFRRV